MSLLDGFAINFPDPAVIALWVLAILFTMAVIWAMFANATTLGTAVPPRVVIALTAVATFLWIIIIVKDPVIATTTSIWDFFTNTNSLLFVGMIAFLLAIFVPKK